MTALLDRVSLRGEAARDVLAVWLTITAALTYLDVPLRHSPLFAANIVLQASLGMLVITRLLRGVAPSLLLLCGPGLILGGALSFAVFQVVGRGLMGLLTQLSVAVVALTLVLRKTPSGLSPTRRMTSLLQITGLAALAMSSEFPWLLIVAGASFLATMALGSPLRKSHILLAGIALLYGALLAIATLFRGASWWLITDDYKFFEVLSYHVTRSGPFSDWGALNVSRYHWLSYGWSGLLDYASGSPEVLVTLTRVMPFTYSAAIAASLLLILSALMSASRLQVSFLATLPIWAILAAVRLDWAAISTGGAFVSVVAVLAVLTYGMDSTSDLPHRICIYLLFAAVAVLTKLPSALMLPPMILAFEVIHRKSHRRRQERMISALGVMLIGGVLVVALLPLLSAVVGNFSIEPKRLPGLLYFYGPVASLVTVSVRHLWILIWILVTWIASTRFGPRKEISNNQILILSLSPFLALGITMESLVAGAFNTHEYFSGPSYLLATLTLVGVAPTLVADSAGRLDRHQMWVWTAIGAATLAWKLGVRSIELPGFLSRATFRESLTDGRIVLGSCLFFVISRRERQMGQKLLIPLLAMLLFAFGETVTPFASQLIDRGTHPERPADEIVSNLGPPDSKAVGTWLRENTPTDDLIATNSLFLEPDSQVFGDDYSLAMWSRREFLVLGPKFFGVIETAPERVELGVRFAREPTARDADALSDFGVRWFVIDLTATTHREWTAYGEIVLKTERFWVLKLLGSSPS